MLNDNQLSKDNQLSTVLLLVALGFLIYYLTKPKNVSESFADEEVKTVIRQEVSALPEIRQELRAAMETVQAESPKSVSEAPASMALAEVKPEVLRQILAESEVRPEARAKVSAEAEKPVFDFEANDSYETGAELDSAFQRPIPQQARPDEVPINKNNLKSYDAKDFLPKEINSQWFDTDFSQAKYNVNDDKLINTERYVIGVNTVGQSLKNATYDIRGTVPNPKFTVSPWNNSTYEPDFNLKSIV
jgi:hypothetical protein